MHAEFLLRGLLNRSTSSLSGKGQFAADGEEIKGREAFIHPFIFIPADAKSRPPRKDDVGRYSAEMSMHTTLNVNSVFIEFTFRPEEWRVFIATVKAAHPDKDAASAMLNLRQDESPKGRDSLLALFTTAVSLQGRRPEQCLLFSAQRINTRRDKQQDAG
ncbi:hypothetical protein [Klebsiella grimontii]|uniref:hypothetical protein n=2 Tax=Klebsiella TaxID=570 RepID=UPI0010464C06|nr:hypothetical protein [Klebsiella grimontii]TCZ55616.1 hypothetical protein E0D83_26170 [Klebsiella grimontii]